MSSSLKKKKIKIGESLSFFINQREVRGDKIISITGNTGIFGGATSEAGGMGFNFDKK